MILAALLLVLLIAFCFLYGVVRASGRRRRLREIRRELYRDQAQPERLARLASVPSNRSERHR